MAPKGGCEALVYRDGSGGKLAEIYANNTERKDPGPWVSNRHEKNAKSADLRKCWNPSRKREKIILIFNKQSGAGRIRHSKRNIQLAV